MLFGADEEEWAEDLWRTAPGQLFEQWFEGHPEPFIGQLLGSANQPQTAAVE